MKKAYWKISVFVLGALLLGAVLFAVSFLFYGEDKGKMCRVSALPETETQAETETGGGTGPELEQEAESAQLIQEPLPAASSGLPQPVPSFEGTPSQKECKRMVEMIKQGDFSCVTQDKGRDYEGLCQIVFGYSEWVEYDVNKDGCEELILQMTDDAGPNEYRILALFTYVDGKMECPIFDFNDFSEYFFLGLSGNLIYTAPNMGGDIDSCPYACYTLELDGELQFSYELLMLDYTGINTPSMEKRQEYYKIAEDTEENRTKEKLTKEEFLSAYQEMAGFEFADPDFAGCL